MVIIYDLCEKLVCVTACPNCIVVLHSIQTCHCHVMVQLKKLCNLPCMLVSISLYTSPLYGDILYTYR